MLLEGHGNDWSVFTPTESTHALHHADESQSYGGYEKTPQGLYQ
jgi:hypothetical protein